MGLKQQMTAFDTYLKYNTFLVRINYTPFMDSINEAGGESVILEKVTDNSGNLLGYSGIKPFVNFLNNFKPAYTYAFMQFHITFNLAVAKFNSATITNIVVGNGGHNSDGTAKPYNQWQTALHSQKLNKAATVTDAPDGSSTTVTISFANSEIQANCISEIGIIDNTNTLKAYKNFSPILVDNNQNYTISITLNWV